MGTAAFVNPGVYASIVDGLSEYLERHGVGDVNDVVGTLKYPGDTCEKPAR